MEVLFLVVLGVVVLVAWIWLKIRYEDQERQLWLDNHKHQKSKELDIVKEFDLRVRHSRANALQKASITDDEIAVIQAVSRSPTETIVGDEHFSWKSGGYEVLLLRDGRIAVISYAYFHPYSANQTEIAIPDEDSCLSLRVVIPRNVRDVLYKKEVISVYSGRGKTSGSFSGTASTKTISLLGSDMAAGISEGHFSGSIDTSSKEGGLTFEFPTYASIEILLNDSVESIHIGVSCGVSFDDKDMLENLYDPGCTEEWLGHEIFYEVSVLESLCVKMKTQVSSIASNFEKLKTIEKYAGSSLDDDSYKLFLSSRYAIQKNDLFEKYVVSERMFESLDAALEFAHADFQSQTPN
jgi:hypothetical protein